MRIERSAAGSLQPGNSSRRQQRVGASRPRHPTQSSVVMVSVGHARSPRAYGLTGADGASIPAAFLRQQCAVVACCRGSGLRVM